MRLVVTGKTGQVVTALRERAAFAGVEIIAIGRPELDLARAGNASKVLARLEPDAIVSAAAFTAVDRAETEQAAAWAINAEGAGHLAAAAQRLGVPLVHLSTDYVFDGAREQAYVESDPTGPLNVYGASKLGGEQAIAAATDNFAVLRTAWLYSPFGANFVKTMLRLGAEQPVVRVVGDQFGNPTSALDLADAVFRVAHNLVTRCAEPRLRGVFHITGSGTASWADFAREIFAVSQGLGGPAASVVPIETQDYPAVARRPASSRLSSARLAEVHGVVLPEWQASTAAVVGRLVAAGACVGWRKGA